MGLAGPLHRPKGGRKDRGVTPADNTFDSLSRWGDTGGGQDSAPPPPTGTSPAGEESEPL